MHPTRLASGALSIALATSLLAGSAAAEPARFQPRAAEAARFQGWTPLSEYVSAGLGEGGTFRLTLPTRAGNLEVAFHPSTVHGARYHGEEVARGARRGRGLPQVRTFAGSVTREGHEAAAPRRGGDFARLALEPGGRVSGLLRVDGVLYDLAADAAAGDLVLQVRELTPEELGETLAACGAQVDAALAAAAEAGTAEPGSGPVSEAAGTLREIELGTEADAPFVAQTGGVAAANAKILSIVNSINGIYEFDLGLTNRVVFQRGWNGSDPYTSSDSGVLLNEFRSRFLADVASATDDAQLFSGRDFDGSTVGRAFVSATCGGYRFGVNQYYQQNDSLTRLIVAHEMGHNLGGSHASDGIMASSINPNVTWFSSTSKSEIGSYVGRVACLAEVDAGGPPQLQPIGPQSVPENQTLALQLEASDPDGDPLHWSALPLPAGASLSADGAFSWRPALATVGCGGFVDRSITFSATDPDGNRASETVVISVLDAPSGAAPVLSDPADRSVAAGQALSIPLSASDADGDSVSFSATGLPGGASLSPAGQFSWTPQPAQVGTHSIGFTATDCTGRSASQSVSIEVATSAPVLGALSAASGSKGDLLTLTGQNLAGKKVRVWFGPNKAKAREVTATNLVVKVPKKSKQVLGNQVAVTVVRDGIPSVNALSFTWLAPTP
jgi:hypothetical protein